MPAPSAHGRLGVVRDEAGPGEGDRPGPVLTAKCVRLLPHSQNALCWLHGGRGGLLPGSYLLLLVKAKKVNTHLYLSIVYARLLVYRYT